MLIIKPFSFGIETFRARAEENSVTGPGGYFIMDENVQPR